jgi:hypothetical protein
LREPQENDPALSDERTHDRARAQNLEDAERAMKDVPKGWPVNPASQMWGEFTWEPKGADQ